MSVVLGALAAGCVPTIKNETPPTYAELQFDPTHTPPFSPSPIVIVINQTTQTIDMSLAGINVPADCANAATAAPPETAMATATCTFYQYLQSLDGFPTVSQLTTPASEALDPASLTAPANVFVYDANSQTTLGASDLLTAFDAATSSIQINALAGWDVGTRYTVAIRGYQHGVKAVSGHEVIGSQIYFFLKSPDSLTCGAAAGSAVDPSCTYYQVVAQPGQTADEVSATLSQLEQLRMLWLSLNVWQEAAQAGGMPQDEVAIVWSFPTHSASTVELQPPAGMKPIVVGTKELDLKAKGTIKADTVTPFILGAPGSVILLDLTALASLGPTDPSALPAFAPTVANGAIVLTTTDDNYPLVDGHQYGIMLLDTITNEVGTPIVPSPLTVMLRMDAPLVACPSGYHVAIPPADPTAATCDADAGDGTTASPTSLIPSVTDADAATAEAGRQQLKPLLDQLLPLVQLTREQIAYLYAFTYPSP